TNTYTGTTVGGGTTAAGFGRVYINGSNTGTGAVNATGGGNVGAGGTIGGIGSVAGAVTISSTTATAQGGFLAPGSATGPSTGGNGIGTFTAASAAATGMTLNPLATYTFDHQPDATQFTGAGGSPAPGVNNDTVNVAKALSLANLTAGTNQVT